ncbi:HAMP domain-containing histidine kinase [Erysipelotrichaceae bacterium RD49]|nr:HAMP domain-containing histidine kinase [Erysipelotrichaceae bacterium RD49]
MKSKKKIPVFSILLSVLILVLSILATQISSRIYISTNAQKTELVNMFSDQLADNAIYRARSLDPEADWLILQDAPPQSVRSYIETNLSSLIHLNGDQMSKDSNLAWIITYKGKQYKHNWKDAYDQDPAALEYTIRSAEGKITYQGANVPANPFSRELSLQVNPSIVPEDRLTAQGTGYSYALTLPDDFSIRYYIPAQIKSNGGIIASSAASFDDRNIRFSVIGGSLVIFLFVLIIRWRFEQDAWMIGHFCKLQAIFAWTALVLAGIGSIQAVQSVCRANASGELAMMFKSFGMSTKQAAGMSFLCALLLWGLLFEIVSLACLYIKSIMCEGFVRYLDEDTLTGELIRKGQKVVSETLQSEKNSRTGLHLALTAFIFCALVCLVMAIAARIGIGWLLVAFVLAILITFVFIMGVYQTMTRSYGEVEEAAQQLAKGNFNDLEERQIGFYQTLYDLMVDAAKSSRDAVKEGLASQISKTQLISNVSHDLKTPVAGIQSYSELITMSDNMEDIHEYAKRLSNYSMRLNDLITDLFDIAKATSGDIQLEPIDLDLSELVMQVAAEWDDQFQQKHLRMVFDLDKEAILHLDPGKTVRVIENLLSNIYKYSLEGTRVFIELHARDGLYQLMMKNTSSTEMNFSPDQIVERFVRGDASRHEKGSGLGLAIVKSFVEIQQGTFEVMTDGDLFKAIISFAIPPVPVVPMPEDAPKPIQQPFQEQPARMVEEGKQPASDLVVSVKPVESHPVSLNEKKAEPAFEAKEESRFMERPEKERPEPVDFTLSHGLASADETLTSAEIPVVPSSEPEAPDLTPALPLETDEETGDDLQDTLITSFEGAAEHQASFGAKLSDWDEKPSLSASKTDDPLLAIELETDPIKKASMISALGSMKDLNENSQKIVAQRISAAIHESDHSDQMEDTAGDSKDTANG